MQHGDHINTPHCMHILSIIAHPRPASFCHAIADVAHETVRSLGHSLSIHDLYVEGFDPVLRPEEAYTTGDAVEDVLAKPTDPLIASHRADIAQADGLLVIHPNWWGKPPAILSGWLDRVLVPGVAYRLQTGDGVPKGLLDIRNALILNTSDTAPELEDAVLGDPLDAIWRCCVLPYCGVQNTHRYIFRPIAGSTVAQRRDWLDTVPNHVRAAFGS